MSTAALQPASASCCPGIGRSILAHWIVLGVMAAVYLALFAYYYPCTFGIEDEVGYLNQALVWSRGSLSAEGAGFSYVFDFTEFNGQHVSYRNPGRSLLVLPFILMGSWQGSFVVGAAIHLLLTLAAALCLARLGRSPLWAVMVLCHPTLALHSRTLMSDTPASLGLTAAFLALNVLRRPGLWAGAAIGLAAVMRYQVGLVLPFFALAILATPSIVDRRREALACLASGGFIGAALVVYNYLTTTRLLGLYLGHGFFSLDAVLPNLAWFATALLVIWPFMLLSPLFDGSPTRWAARAIVVPLFAVAVGWFFHDRHSSLLYSLVLVQRQLITFLPVWIIGYAWVAEELVVHRLTAVFPAALLRLTIACGCAGLLVLLGAMFDRHQRHLKELKTARDEVIRAVPEGSLLIANSTLQKLLGFPSPEFPAYRLRSYDYQGIAQDQSVSIQAEQRTWYLALLPKAPGSELPEPLRDYVSRYHMTRVPTEHPALLLYTAVVPSRHARVDEVQKVDGSKAE